MACKTLRAPRLLWGDVQDNTFHQASGRPPQLSMNHLKLKQLRFLKHGLHELPFSFTWAFWSFWPSQFVPLQLWNTAAHPPVPVCGQTSSGLWHEPGRGLQGLRQRCDQACWQLKRLKLCECTCKLYNLDKCMNKTGVLIAFYTWDQLFLWVKACLIKSLVLSTSHRRPAWRVHPLVQLHDIQILESSKANETPAKRLLFQKPLGKISWDLRGIPKVFF